LLKNCRYVVASFNPLKIYEHIDIVFNGNKIVCLGTCKEYKDDEVIDCSKSIVFPAFASSHTHINTPNGIDSVKEYYRTVLLLLLSHGVSAIQFMGENHRVVAKIARELGMRIATGPIIKTYGDLSSIDVYPQDELYRPIINIPSIEIDENTFVKIIEFSKENSIDIYIPISEDLNNVFRFKKTRGVFPIEYLAKRSLLSSNMVLLHLNWVTSWEIEILNSNRSRVVICPYKDAFLRSRGLSPIVTVPSNNILIGFGLDTIENLRDTNIETAIITTLALYKNSYRDLQITMHMLLYMYSTTNYRILGFGENIVELGHKPDIAMIDIDILKEKFVSMTHREAADRYSHIIDLVLSSPITMMIINGRVLHMHELSI